MRIMQNIFDEINKYNKYATLHIFIRSIRYMPAGHALIALVAPALWQINTKYFNACNIYMPAAAASHALVAPALRQAEPLERKRK
jgi:hypothetical protein